MVGMVLKVLGAPPLDSSETNPEKIEIYHIDTRLSDTLADVGQAGLSKVVRLLRFCAKAILWRFRYGIKAFYYVPAPPHRVAILRDWIALALCRPFFKTTIYHWHASGMGEWLLKSAKPWERRLTIWIVARPNLSIILREGNRTDPDALGSRKTAVVPYGISDPCPEFETMIKSRRIERAAFRARLAAASGGENPQSDKTSSDLNVYRILFMSLCVREKGLFDLVDAVALFAGDIADSKLRIELVVAGSFVNEAERSEFERRIAQPDLKNQKVSVRYQGFVNGTDKTQLLEEADCFCFPTYYGAESFGLVSIEAMAFGVPVIASNWRGLPELFPDGYPWIISPQSPRELAALLKKLSTVTWDPSLRLYFLQKYSEDIFARNMRAAVLSQSTPA
jgi:glycosyltransferase involved in cell wall biosynthesis